MAIDKEGKKELENEFYGQKTIIISKSGFGKSYTARVVIEEGLKNGNTFIVFDPQDAYLNLEGFEYIPGEEIKSAKGLGVLLSQTNKNVVISTKGLTVENQNKLVNVVLTNFKKNVRKGIQTIVIDEMHKFAPNMGKTEAKSTIQGMFQENRSDGVGIIGVSQRPQRIDTTILSQADNLFLGRVTSFRDKQAVGNYLDNKEQVEGLATLEKGQFFMSFAGDTNPPETLMIRESETEHSGNAPENLLTENSELYNNHANSVVSRRKSSKKSTEGTNQMEKDPVKILKEIVPGKKGFLSAAATGAMVTAGFALNGVVSTQVGRFVKTSPVPGVSVRTLTSLGATLVTFAGMQVLPSKMSKVKEAVNFAVAGGAVATLGSALVDAAIFVGMPIPPIVGQVLAIGTGVSSPAPENGSVDQAPGVQGLDLNTAFA